MNKTVYYPNCNFFIGLCCALGNLSFLSERSWSVGSVVSMSESCPGGCEFDTRLMGTYFLAYFCLSPLKHVRKK